MCRCSVTECLASLPSLGHSGWTLRMWPSAGLRPWRLPDIRERKHLEDEACHHSDEDSCHNPFSYSRLANTHRQARKRSQLFRETQLHSRSPGLASQAG